MMRKRMIVTEEIPCKQIQNWALALTAYTVIVCVTVQHNAELYGWMDG